MDSSREGWILSSTTIQNRVRTLAMTRKSRQHRNNVHRHRTYMEYHCVETVYPIRFTMNKRRFRASRMHYWATCVHMLNRPVSIPVINASR